MIVFSTNNAHKLKEVQEILPDFEVCSLKDLNIIVDPEENGLTYYENSLIKAKAIREFTKLPILADDSGLEIEMMPNELGLYTSRYKPELTQYEKNETVLKIMEGVKNRKAKFVCCAILLVNDKVYSYYHECHGTISLSQHGKNGFGYNPVFIPDGYDKTFAELDDVTKNKISHRGVAMRKLVEQVLSEGVKL